MAKPKLIVSNDYARDGYYLCWYFPDEGDEGAFLGEQVYTQDDLKKAKPDEWDHVKATIVASKTEGACRYDYRGYRWPSLRAARAALKIVKAALKDKSDKIWPDWALTAKAAGWTPPKGWTP